jgi:hypothetical protein
VSEQNELYEWYLEKMEKDLSEKDKEIEELNTIVDMNNSTAQTAEKMFEMKQVIDNEIIKRK